MIFLLKTYFDTKLNLSAKDNVCTLHFISVTMETYIWIIKSNKKSKGKSIFLLSMFLIILFSYDIASIWKYEFWVKKNEFAFSIHTHAYEVKIVNIY